MRPFQLFSLSLKAPIPYMFSALKNGYKRGFPKTSAFGKAALNLLEKAGRTLVRFDRFFKSISQNQPGFGKCSKGL
jgi:hypothetical protein